MYKGSRCHKSRRKLFIALLSDQSWITVVLNMNRLELRIQGITPVIDQ